MFLNFPYAWWAAWHLPFVYWPAAVIKVIRRKHGRFALTMTQRAQLFKLILEFRTVTYGMSNIIRFESGPSAASLEHLAGVMERYAENQLEIDGCPITLQIFVLVTSTSPLRLLQYSDGLVFFRHPPYTPSVIRSGSSQRIFSKVSTWKTKNQQINNSIQNDSISSLCIYEEQLQTRYQNFSMMIFFIQRTNSLKSNSSLNSRCWIRLVSS